MIWFISIWAISSIICHGMLFAWCQRGFNITNYREDLVFSITVSFIGNIFSFMIVIMILWISNKNPLRYGFKFW